MSPSTFTLNDGTRVPIIAFGTGSAFRDKDVTHNVVIAIQNGFTHIDGGQRYHNEASVGAGIRKSGKPRSDIYITTKLGALAPGETPASSLKKSLGRLGVTYVDMFLIHFPGDHPVDKLKEVWKGMEEARAAGLTISIGVSNFTVDHLKDILEVAKIYPAVNQVEAHPHVWKALGPNLEIHKKYGITTSSFGGLSPIVRGKGGPLDPVIEKIRVRLENTRGRPVSDSQVLIKWLQQKHILVVTTSTKSERIRQYIDTENIPELTLGEVKLIDTTGAKLHRRFFPGSWPPE